MFKRRPTVIGQDPTIDEVLREEPRSVSSSEKVLKNKLKSIPIRNESSMVLILFALSAGLLILLIVTAMLVFTNRSLARQEKVYVQMQSGETEVAQAFDATHRSTEVLQETAVSWMQFTYEWDNRIPGSDKTDAGFRLNTKQGRKVPTKIYLGSYLLESGFRQEFLTLLADKVIPKDVYNGGTRSVVRVYSIGTPTQMGNGVWTIDIVSTRIESTVSREIKEIPINFKIWLQAVPVVKPLFGDDEPLAWRQKIYQLLQNGIMITKVEDMGALQNAN